MKKVAWIILLVIAILTLVGTGVYIYLDGQNKREIERLYDEMARNSKEKEKKKPKVEEPKITTFGVQNPERYFNWDELHAQNPDIFAWIHVPDTNIDYPVLRHESDDVIYLNTNLDGSPGYPGCIYVEPSFNERNMEGFNTVFYGHNMRDGSMFATLHSFENPDFFNQQHYVYIYDENGNQYAYEIFAAYPRDDWHILAGYDLSTDETRAAYLNIVKEMTQNGQLKEGLFPLPTSKMICLSTCMGNDQTRRYVVAGVLVGEKTAPKPNDSVAAG